MKDLGLLAKIAQLDDDELQDAINGIAARFAAAPEEERERILGLLARIQDLAAQRARPN
jgi:hypothetical protein